MPDMPHLAGGFAAPHDHPRLNVRSPESCPPEVRLVTSPDTALVVGAAPMERVGHLLRQTPFRRRPLAYLLMASAAPAQPTELYVGETLDGEVRMAEHRRDPRLPADEVVLIACHDDAFGRDAIQALQHGLTAQAHRAGRCRVIGKPPQRSWLQNADPEQLARWLRAVRPMLVAAGCSLLEPPGARLRPRSVAALPGALQAPRPAVVLSPEPAIRPVPEPVLQGYSLDLPAGLLARADARHYVLAWAGVRAEAVAAGAWTVLRAGSRVAPADDPGIQLCLSRKRQALAEAGVLRPSGRGGLLRVERDVALPSLTNACRVVTGTNRPGSLWAEA
ncbi:hypothetical protein ABS771_28375 [Methylobacterium brachiatum]|uniref:GIY-YIG nuclease family protein n=1 Tax=Methylobacterium brachiatum TaxID=269660 RepID=A0ABV1RBH7_9HYPH